MSPSFAMRKFAYYLLIFGLKSAGYLSTSKQLFSFIFLQILTASHIAILCSMISFPLIYGSYMLQQSEGFGFWLYIAMVVHTITCLSIITCLVESVIQRRGHQKLVVRLKKFKYDSESYRRKLNKVTVKFVAVLVSVMTLSYLTIREYQSLSYYQFYAVRYTSVMMVIKYFQFNVAADVLGIELEVIRDKLRTGLKYKRRTNPFIVKLKLFELRSAYEDTLEMSNLINKCFSWTLLLMGITFISHLIALGYWGLISVMKNIFVLTPMRK